MAENGLYKQVFGGEVIKEIDNGGSSPTSEDIFYIPSLKKTNIGNERRHEKTFMKPDDYLGYVGRPFVETVSEPLLLGCIQGMTHTNDIQSAWADMSNEMMASARLLPSYQYKGKFLSPPDASKLVRSEFLEKDSALPIWWFNGKFIKDNYKFKIAIKEIDVSGIHGNVSYDQSNMQICQDVIDQRYDGCMKLMKELYILHYFRHENLLHAYFTRSEPALYRMNIALPRTIPIMKISSTFKLQYHWEKSPAMPYVAICILRALAYLHKCNIVHKNVCVENCFYDGNGNVLLGGFENVDICRRGEDHLFLYDIWNVATTILDFVLETTEYGLDFPDPSCIDGYDSLFDKMSSVKNTYRSNNNPEKLLLRNALPGEKFQNVRLGYITSLISRRSSLYKFLDLLLHPADCPTADFLLQFYPYTAVAEEDFKQLRKELFKKCRDEDEFGELKISPFCQERKAPALLETVNPRHISNALKSKPKPSKCDIPDSHFQQSKVTNPSTFFPAGTPLYLTFTMHSDMLQDPIIYEGKIVVGSEHTFFKLFCDLNSYFNEELAIEHSKEKGVPWNLMNCPGRLIFPWDVFRLRTGLQTMLTEGANGLGHFKLEGDAMVARHGFILCQQVYQKVSRRVGVEIRTTKD